MNKLELRIKIDWQEYNKELQLPEKLTDENIKEIFNMLAEWVLKSKNKLW